MNRAMHAFVRGVDRFNHRIGRITMYGIFAMMAVLLWSTFSKVGSDLGFAINPSLWTLETAQFLLVAYYILGGPYSIQLGSNVRMDLFYGSWTDRKKAWVDGITVMFLAFYLGVLFWGAVGSTAYSLGHFSGNPFAFFWDLLRAFVTGGPDAASEVLGRPERSPTAWRPYLWPVKAVMTVGIFLMFLQAVSEFFKDILRLRGDYHPEKS